MTMDPVKLAIDLALGAVRLAEGIAEAAQRREAATLVEVRERLEAITAAIVPAVAPAFAEREAARRAELEAQAASMSTGALAASLSSLLDQAPTATAAGEGLLLTLDERMAIARIVDRLERGE